MNVEQIIAGEVALPSDPYLHEALQSPILALALLEKGKVHETICNGRTVAIVKYLQIHGLVEYEMDGFALKFWYTGL